MLHIYPMCGIFYLHGIDTDTTDCQIVNLIPHPNNIAQYPAEILLMNVTDIFLGSNTMVE